MEKEFRLQGKKVMLTYAQPGNYWTKEEILKELNKKVIKLKNKLDSYVIGEETHKDGNLHYHVVIVLKTKPDIKKCDIFDLFDKEKDSFIHPNIKVLHTKQIYYQKVLYSIKSGNFIKSEELDLMKIKANFMKTYSLDKLLIELYDVVKEKGYHSAMTYFKENTNPLLFMKECRRVSNILKEASSILNKNLIKADYPNNVYKRVASLEKALDNRESLWFSGPSNLKKSQKTYAEINERGLPGFLLSSNETLSKDQHIPNNAVLVIDDAISKVPLEGRESLIQLFGTERDREIPGRFFNRPIPKGVPVLVLSNTTLYDFLKSHGCEDDLAVLRRIKDVHIQEDLKITMNILIQGDNNNIEINNRPFAKETSSIPNRNKNPENSN